MILVLEHFWLTLCIYTFHFGIIPDSYVSWVNVHLYSNMFDFYSYYCCQCVLTDKLYLFVHSVPLPILQ